MIPTFYLTPIPFFLISATFSVSGNWSFILSLNQFCRGPWQSHITFAYHALTLPSKNHNRRTRRRRKLCTRLWLWRRDSAREKTRQARTLAVRQLRVGRSSRLGAISLLLEPKHGGGKRTASHRYWSSNQCLPRDSRDIRSLRWFSRSSFWIRARRAEKGSQCKVQLLVLSNVNHELGS